MTQSARNSSNVLTGFLVFLVNLGTIVVTFAAYKNRDLLLIALAMFIFSSGFKAFYQGALAELLSLARLAVSFLAAWLFKAEIANLLPIKGILGEIAGFYSLFILIYLAAGQGIKHALKEHEPSRTSKIFGAGIGAFEGLLIGLFVFFAMSLVPGSSLSENPPEFISKLFGSTEKIVAPMLPEKAGNAVQAMKTMSRISRKLDPAKVDQIELAEAMRPLAEMDEITQLQSNPEIQRLLENRDFPALIRHPALKNLLENPSLQEKIMNLDWKRIEKALHSGQNQEP